MNEVKYANPAPLGLMGFGMTTVLLNLHNIGLYGLGSMILAMGIFYGGLAQIIAGIMEFKKGNTFGTAAFSSYGLFWLSLVFLLVFPRLGWAPPFERTSIAAYFFLWGLFTALMSLATLKYNKALQTVFISLAILFFLLVIGLYIPIVTKIAGVEGVFCGFSAIYLAIAEILNEAYNKEVLPIGVVKKP
jgi:succinate-acetate transporter protein